ncbi:MAG TPA: PQQ-binding-like beta-propeller repeat protein, partial [Thermoanaerobaculales bacterium]|nr:PQQ-binding-like beta-propeller repeat protein [Thermoanaerobaculales bacterium]
MSHAATLLLCSLLLTTPTTLAASPPDVTDGAPPVVPPGNTVVRIGSPGAAPRELLGSAPPVTLRDVGSSCLGSWQNSGGTPARDGRSDELGPTTADLLWSGGRPSLIAWQPITDGDRVFMVRQADWPSSPPEDSPVVAMDLATGAELWAIHLPYEPGDWTTWIAAAHSGLVFASRAGNGASVSAKMYALDQEDGSVEWASSGEVDSGAYDGVVLAPDGDLLVGNFGSLMRIDAGDGSTVWSVPRVCSVSSSCGPATSGDAVYVADATGGGHVIVRHDLATGAVQYQSPVMPGFTLQNTPFVGPDGTVYLSRTQENPATDYFYAFEDTGTALVERWHVPAAWTAFTELAVTADGSPFMLAPGYELVRLDPVTGATVDSAGLFPECTYGTRMATDGNGTFYLGNGSFDDGRLRVFDADLDLLWETPVTNINIGGPAIGHGGALVACGVGTDVRAYRPEPSTPVCMPFTDGFESGDTSAW